MQHPLLIGAWTLASWRRIAADGSVTYPMGELAMGRLLYAADGHMRVFLTRPDASPSNERASFIAYSGGFTLHDGAVHHLIDMASDPNLIGTVQVRGMQLAGDELVLSAPDAVQPQAQHILQWRRATN